MFVILLEFCNVSGVVNIKDIYLPVLQNLGIYTNILNIQILCNSQTTAQLGVKQVYCHYLRTIFREQKSKVC